MKISAVILAGFAALALIAVAPPACADDPRVEQCHQVLRDQAQLRQACDTCPAPALLSDDQAKTWWLHPFCVMQTARGWDIIPGGRISPDEVLLSVAAGAVQGTVVGNQRSTTLSTPIADASSGNCGYYTNSDGDRVPRPCGNWHTQPPPQNATAECRDGTYSYSRHRTGTCSYHGGVVSFR